MPGPSPKDPSTRQRRNRTSTSKLLSAVDDPEIPDLPETSIAGRMWTPGTEEWWVAIWSSPMSPEYTDSDYFGILALAQLWNEREWAFVEGRVTAALNLSTEIRLAQRDYGFTLAARRRSSKPGERQPTTSSRASPGRTATANRSTSPPGSSGRPVPRRRL